MAPGPPRVIAVATPAMFPVPTVAESAVVRAWKGVISPSFFSGFIDLKMSFMAVGSFLIPKLSDFHSAKKNAGDFLNKIQMLSAKRPS